MYAIERRQWLIERARTSGRIDVSTMSEELGLAPETIRRDLNDLERQGLVRRVYGGAVPVERLAFESGLTMRAQRRQEEKNRIAQAAATYVRAAESIYIDEGNLPQLIADHLRPERPITVVTPSLPIATSLVDRDNVEVIVLGGRVRATTLGAVDHWAVGMLSTLVLDLAFMGANGVTLEHGLTVPDGAVAAVKSMAMRVSRRRIFVADSSKYGSDSFVRFAELNEFERFVTDDALSVEHAAELHARGIEVTRA
ncbi:DeoR/GlpR family DNA-binding transcription regulator [Jatrophihabitans telluris]|uniref:Lactose phosphotransferase system repressor n=1 Tax=Jatrophihabitans telluris TaxID=2038343 RepID=A0ABY4QVI9_9ACTN|nr:DeoR/GlpR family DNA-binding transcription regulator [Jatrophihabitans telluris]UQX87575.1 DeoR/GlpR family DNA-binding transcription regulator [Jatrophihabitans telluris]